MTTSRPRLASVVIPAHNAEAFLSDAVRSVLDQTWRQLELIIVDDGSTDGTGPLADELRAADDRIRVVHKPNGGLSSARNAGIAAAKGDALSFLDADDAFLPEKLAHQMAFLEHFPGCDLVFSDYYIGDRDLTPIWLESVQPPTDRMNDYVLFRNAFAPFCPLLRRRLVRAVGTFDETLRVSEDWDYWIRAAQVGKFSYLPGPVGVYRTHPQQMHHNHELMEATGRRLADRTFMRGSRRWRIMTASRLWAEGRRAPAGRRLLRTPIDLVRVCFVARSPRIVRNVLRWAR